MKKKEKERKRQKRKKKGNCLLESFQLHHKFTFSLTKIHFKTGWIFWGFLLLLIFWFFFLFFWKQSSPLPNIRLWDPLMNFNLPNNRDLKDTQFRKYANTHMVGMNGFKLMEVKLKLIIRGNGMSFEIPSKPDLGFCANQQPERKSLTPQKETLRVWHFLFHNLNISPFSGRFWSQLTPFCGLVGEGEVLGLRENLIAALLNAGAHSEEMRLTCFTRCLSRFSSHSNCLSQSWNTSKSGSERGCTENFTFFTAQQTLSWKSSVNVVHILVLKMTFSCSHTYTMSEMQKKKKIPNIFPHKSTMTKYYLLAQSRIKRSDSLFEGI